MQFRGSDSATKGAGMFKTSWKLGDASISAEGEMRDERFCPERGKNQGIGHTSATGSYRKADGKLRGRAVPKANGWIMVTARMG